MIQKYFRHILFPPTIFTLILSTILLVMGYMIDIQYGDLIAALGVISFIGFCFVFGNLISEVFEEGIDD